MIRGNLELVRGIQIFSDADKENVNPNGQPPERRTRRHRIELFEELARMGHGNSIQRLYIPRYQPRIIHRIFNEQKIRSSSGEYIEMALDRALLEIGQMEQDFDEFLPQFKDHILAGKEALEFLQKYNKRIMARNMIVHIVVEEPGDQSMFHLYFENKDAIENQTEEDLLKLWAKQIKDNESYRRMEISPIPNPFNYIVDVEINWESVPHGGLWHYAMIFEPAMTKAINADMAFAVIDLAYNAKNIVVHLPIPYEMIQMIFRMQHCYIRSFEMLESISPEEDEKIMLIMARNKIKKLALYKGTVTGRALIETIEVLKAAPGMKVTIGNLKLTYAEFEELRDEYEIVFYERDKPTMYIIRIGEAISLILTFVALNVEIQKEPGREDEISTDVLPSAKK